MVLALPLAFLSVTTSVAVQVSPDVQTRDGMIQTYYGISTSLNHSDLETLPLPFKRGVQMSEGFALPTAAVSTKNGILVEVVFGRRGHFISMKTKSLQATDQRGSRVGDTLSDVQKRWPCGRLYYGNSIEGGHPYASFFTGTNVLLRMSTEQFDDLLKLKVNAIEIVNFSTADTAGMACSQKADPYRAGQ